MDSSNNLDKLYTRWNIVETAIHDVLLFSKASMI